MSTKKKTVSGILLGAGYWGFAIFAESSLYVINLVLSGVAMMKVLNFNPYATQQPHASNV